MLPFLFKQRRWTGATDERHSVVVHLRVQGASQRSPSKGIHLRDSPSHTRVVLRGVPADYLVVLRCMLATKVPRGSLVSSVHERREFRLVKCLIHDQYASLLIAHTLQHPGDCAAPISLRKQTRAGSQLN